MEEEKTVLNDVSLCAIVRDEKNNPAGGIKRFADSHVPYVDEAVIVDTGSVDGTRKILEECCALYSNLRVFDHKFDGYAESRNFSLTNVRTKFALILDADELLTHKKPQNDFRELGKFIDVFPAKVYNFKFEHYSPIGETPASAHRERLFELSPDIAFAKYCWEFLDTCLKGLWVNNITIKHFLPSQEARHLKRIGWYNQLFDKQSLPPSKTEGFKKWKKFNPLRNKFE